MTNLEFIGGFLVGCTVVDARAVLVAAIVSTINNVPFVTIQ